MLLQGSFVKIELCFNPNYFFSSSSDSDSDPEGGELPDIYSRKDEQPPRKKKVKKRRPEKAIEERVQKLNQKRQVNRFRNMIPNLPYLSFIC